MRENAHMPTAGPRAYAIQRGEGRGKKFRSLHWSRGARIFGARTIGVRV